MQSGSKCKICNTQLSLSSSTDCRSEIFKLLAPISRALTDLNLNLIYSTCMALGHYSLPLLKTSRINDKLCQRAHKICRAPYGGNLNPCTIKFNKGPSQPVQVHAHMSTPHDFPYSASSHCPYVKSIERAHSPQKQKRRKSSNLFSPA